MTTPWILAALALTTPARALQLELSRPELCDLVTEVVLVEVTDIETRFGADGLIEREAHLAVLERVRGSQADALDLHLPGGTLGEMTVRVEDVPNLLENAQYLVFAAPDPQGRLVVIGGDQGAARITPPGSRRGEPRQAALDSVEVCRAR